MSQSTPPQTKPTGDRRAELERIKAATWPKESREEREARIARALACFESLPRLALSPAAIKRIAEDPDLDWLEG